MPGLVEEFYEDFHHKVDANYNADKFLLDRDVHALNYIKGSKRVFELGCGTGRLLELSGAAVRCGIDISRATVALAKNNGVDARYLDIDSAELPFPDNAFDAALAIETLEHLFDPVHALAEVNRVLEPGGKLCVTCPNIGYWVSRLALLTGRFTDFTGSGLLVPEHIRFHTVNSLKLLCRQAGFQVVDVHGCAKLPSAANDQIKIAWPDWRALRNGPVTIRQKMQILIYLIDKYLSPVRPALARGLCLVAVKDGPPRYKRNVAFDCFSTAFDYVDHYRRG